MNPRLNKRKSLSEKKLIIPNPTKKKRKQNVKSEKKNEYKEETFLCFALSSFETLAFSFMFFALSLSLSLYLSIYIYKEN